MKENATKAKAAPAAKSTNDTAGASVSKTDGGRTIIRNQVVAKIAGLAVREIDGVHRLVPFGAGQSVERIARTVTGAAMRDIGVQVEVGEKEAAVDVRIITDYGASIPAVGDAIRRNVADRVGSMTGLKIVQVNIDVVDLFFLEDDEDIEEDVDALHLQ